MQEIMPSCVLCANSTSGATPVSSASRTLTVDMITVCEAMVVLSEGAVVLRKERCRPSLETKC